ncbi:MAG: DUF2157 domain-containing protein [Synergistaceae bacterium]|nr:DUF2157 domain-containing protein [Synergistaceae bacterium]MBR0253753.1 DUF2157 domain-containing protein [Synergistaceae bacterium]
MSEIRKKELEFLSGEVNFWQEQNIITSEQSEKILSLYDIKKSNLRLIMFIAGGILLGLGLISFIAAHWHEIPKILRVCILSGGYVASLIAYYLLGTKTKSGRAFLLFASVIFGSGIFLIARMYNYKLYWYTVIGWWLIQVLITALISRDSWQLFFAQILSFIYLNAVNAVDIFALEFANLSKLPVIEFFSPINSFALIIALWIVWNFIDDRIAFNMNMLLTLLLLSSRMSLCFGGTLTLIILTITGAVLSFVSKWHDTEILGLLMTGLFGMLLTWPEFWRGEIFEGVKFLPILTAFLIAVIMLINIYRGHYATGIIFCFFLASRYFFDHLFGYMPKAWGFTLAGIIFVIAGIFFGRITRIFKHNI